MTSAKRTRLFQLVQTYVTNNYQPATLQLNGIPCSAITTRALEIEDLGSGAFLIGGPTALKPLGNSSTQGGAEEQLAQVRAELVAQRQATDILTNEVKSLKSQLVSQVANLTHLVMTLAMEKTPDEDPADPTASESADASPAVRESGEGGGRMRTKSGKERGRRMSLNALTTAGV